MSTHVELQEEEKEVLISIYDSDPGFKQSGPLSFQYKVGSVGEPNSLLVEVTWTELYPDELPVISLDAFFNNHLSQATKSFIIQTLQEVATDFIGSPMTYSIFEHVREHREELIIEQEEEVKEKETGSGNGGGGGAGAKAIGKVKSGGKPQLSKAAKRRQADKLNSQRGLPRGHDWVDIIRLSQTGSSNNGGTSTAATASKGASSSTIT